MRCGKRWLGDWPKRKSNFNIDFMILGHPRSGTGYIAKLFSSLGVEIGHEGIGKHGVSCWTFVAEKANHLHGGSGKMGKIAKVSRQDFNYKHLVHIIRNPFDVINSVYYTESVPYSQVFRLLHALPRISTDFRVKKKEHKENLSDSILSVVRWNNMIESMNPDALFKVESCEEEVTEFLEAQGYKLKKEKVFGNKHYNTRKASSENKLKISDYDCIEPEVLEELNTYCQKHNYKNILK